MISLTCDECDKSLRLRDELAGKRIKCPGCGAVIAVPLDDEDVEDVAPAPRPKAPAPKAAPSRAGKPTKSARDEEDEEEDEEIDDRRRRKVKPAGDVRKPSSVLLILGLVLGLGGLAGMCFFIYQAKAENDRTDQVISNLKHDVNLPQLQADFEMAKKMGANLIAEKEKAKIDALNREIELRSIESSEKVKKSSLIAAVLGIVFLAGVILRGYHFVQMKKWHAAQHGTGKKKKRRNAEDDEDDD